jgi:prepilin-type N-terminal cleavage/methylation domain-containing protein
MLRSEAGYTLLELMVVFLVVGILVSLAIASYAGVEKNGYDAEAQSDLRNAATAAQSYYAGNGSSYKGMTADDLAEEVTGINFADGVAPAEPGYVYVGNVTASSYRLRFLSRGGAQYSAAGNHFSVEFDF